MNGRWIDNDGTWMCSRPGIMRLTARRKVTKLLSSPLELLSSFLSFLSLTNRCWLLDAGERQPKGFTSIELQAIPHIDRQTAESCGKTTENVDHSQTVAHQICWPRLATITTVTLLRKFLCERSCSKPRCVDQNGRARRGAPDTFSTSLFIGESGHGLIKLNNSLSFRTETMEPKKQQLHSLPRNGRSVCRCVVSLRTKDPARSGLQLKHWNRF